MYTLGCSCQTKGLGETEQPAKAKVHPVVLLASLATIVFVTDRLFLEPKRKN